MPKITTASGPTAPRDPFAGINPALIPIAAHEQIAFEQAERAMRLGTDEDRENFISQFGVEQARESLKRELKALGETTPGTGSHEHRKDIELWLNRLDEREGDEVKDIEDIPQS